MRPVAIDANAVACFQHERIAKSGGIATEAINAVFKENCIALDNERLCLQEWINAAAGKFPFALTDWISDQIAVGRIKFFPLSDNTCRKRLLSFGLPPDDHKWVRLALGSAGNVIVTGDVDFLDPTKKKASAATKLAIRTAGKGACSRSLKKEFQIDIVDTHHASAFFP